MKKIIIFGNSGSGKSTIAKKLCLKYELAHLDLDTVAWQPTIPAERKPLSDSKKHILEFIEANRGWVIEGCYSDLIEIALADSSEVIFMNLSIEMCISNARKRPWEPHKYDSKEAQDANLEMLIEWITQYTKREDTFSKKAHDKIYDEYEGTKTLITSNDDEGMSSI